MLPGSFQPPARHMPLTPYDGIPDLAADPLDDPLMQPPDTQHTFTLLDRSSGVGTAGMDWGDVPPHIAAFLQKLANKQGPCPPLPTIPRAELTLPEDLDYDGGLDLDAISDQLMAQLLLDKVSAHVACMQA